MANDITTEDQEMGGAKKLSKSAIRRAYWDWMFYNLSVQNFERMQGPAIIKMLADVREDLYPGDPEAQQEMLERHEVFFNTEPYLGSIVPGIVLGMEASKAEGNDEISSEFINSIKTALMGPFAGIGDSLLPGTLIPILLSIALGMSPNGEVTGPIFYIVVFLAIMLPLTWFLFSYGVKAGANAAELVLSGGIKDKVTRAPRSLASSSWAPSARSTQSSTLASSTPAATSRSTSQASWTQSSPSYRC